MRFLLRPGWIALTVVVVAFAFACYYLLAPWQFHRSDERDGVNDALRTAVSTPPVPRAEIVAPRTAPSPAIQWRQVVVTGTYLPGVDVLIRLRTIEGSPGYEVTTPLATPTGEIVLIDRGYVRAEDRGALPPIAAAPGGPVTVTGYQRLDEAGVNRPAVVADGYRQVYAADARAVGAVTGIDLSPGFIQLRDGQRGVLTAVPLPPPDPNSSYSYAWQWLIFGLMAIGAWVYFVRLEYVTRRGARDRSTTRIDPRDARDGTPWDGEASTADMLADRYGRR